IFCFILVMCPDQKLKWFKDHGRTSAQIRDIKKLVVNCFKESYAPAELSDAHEESALASATQSTHGPSDDITTYLSDPVLASDAIAEAGGYMQYWHQA
ncbi:hypothetical protein L208DRAFT_1184145, partial [Tricholoma matsutake]